MRVDERVGTLMRMQREKKKRGEEKQKRSVRMVRGCSYRGCTEIKHDESAGRKVEEGEGLARHIWTPWP